ncbi:MAG TPA: transcriptional regulator, partial [Fibrobacteria bacterium]|nr:transcriptional regulator [Fibrobacteria bacterium]
MSTAQASFAHGLVIGKFYPPHRGHVHLVESALARCRFVTVQVLHASVESVPGPERARWLERCFGDRGDLRVLHGLDDEPVDYDSPEAWEAHERIMREVLVRADAEDPRPAVDAVFTSEAYGQELARRFRAEHVAVDPARSAHPVSGTAVRADLPGRWMDLPGAVRAGLCRRVVVVGAESSGTTTLSVDLHRALVARGGVWSRTRW